MLGEREPVNQKGQFSRYSSNKKFAARAQTLFWFHFHSHRGFSPVTRVWKESETV